MTNNTYAAKTCGKRMLNWFGIVVMSGALLSCSAPAADETQIRERLDSMVTALEERDMEIFIQSFSADFAAEGMDRRALRWFALRQSQQHDAINVQLAQINVEVLDQFDPPRAKVSFQALMTGGDWLPRDAGWYRVESGWRKDGGENWRMINASWEKQL